MKSKRYWYVFVRYLILIFLGLGNLTAFYFVFTPLTVAPVFWVISLFDGGAKLLEGNLLYFSGYYAEIIPACIAGAAYYLLLILNLTTPMELKKRMHSILLLFGMFLTLNILRILIFSYLLVFGYEVFDFAHRFTWYFGSTALVILIWFGNVWMLKIKEIPVYSDFKKLFGEIFRKAR